MSKTPLPHTVDELSPVYARLLPLVEYSLEQNCTIQNGSETRPFHNTRDGSICDIRGELTLEQVLQVFELPDGMTAGVPYSNCIWDEHHNAVICFGHDAE